MYYVPRDNNNPLDPLATVVVVSGDNKLAIVRKRSKMCFIVPKFFKNYFSDILIVCYHLQTMQ